MDNIWQQTFFGNSVLNWTIAIGIIIAIIFLAIISKRVVIGRLTKITAKTSSTLDDFIIKIVQRNMMPLVLVMAFYAATRYLELPVKLVTVLHAIVTVVTVFYVIRSLTDLLSYMITRFTQGDSSKVKQSNGILLIVKVVLWIFGLLFIAGNLGYNITAIVTGLGIGGIAIALAAQAVLADLFSYLVIFFDKPFETGDYIVIGDKSGAVEHIGIKTTRLRTLDGEQLIMSNTDLTNSRVHNYKRMETRRVILNIGVTYETPVEKLQAIPGMIEEIITRQEDARFDRAHFSEFGDFSLNFEIVFTMLNSDYVKSMNIKQDVGLALFKKFAEEEIEFAYPTQKIFLAKT